MIPLRFFFAAASPVFLLIPMHLLAADAATASGTSSIVIEQKSPTAALGSYTLVDPDLKNTVSKSDSLTISTAKTGRYTLLLTPPNGMSTNIHMIQNGTEVQTINIPQATFSLTQDPLVIRIVYSLQYTGDIAVSTDPAGIPFTLKGPNDIVKDDVSNTSFQRLPIGQYSVQFKPDGCNFPPQHSVLLQSNDRLSVSTTILCSKSSSSAAPVPLLGDASAFSDVPSDAWFKAPVDFVVSHRLLAGYNNADGTPAGTFGPGNPVSVAELAKILVALNNLSPSTAEPANVRARGAWYSPFIAEAEEQHWLLFLDSNLDVTRPATRAEVLLTLLQSLKTPIAWPTKQSFDDIAPLSATSIAAETAVSLGYIDATSRLFRPSDSMNRAELAKLLAVIISKLRP